MSVADSTISTDVQPSGDTGPDDDGFSAFLDNLNDDADDRKKPASTETVEESEESPAPADQGTETETAEEGEAAEADPDDAEIEVKVGDEVKKAKLRDLKRLYGQEASLTQKSQKLAEQTKAAVEQDTRAGAALRAMLERAQARFAPYKDLDMLVLSQRMDTESFQQLRQDAAAAQADVGFLTQELDGHVQATNARAQAATAEAAKACIQVLSDPATGIEGWGEPLYNDIVAFAAANGLPAARSFVDPAAIKLLHMAMLYSKGQKAAKTAAEKVQKVVATPARTLKPGATKASNAGDYNAALSALRRSGSDDDAVAAFAASFDR